MQLFSVNTLASEHGNTFKFIIQISDVLPADTFITN